MAQYLTKHRDNFYLLHFSTVESSGYDTSVSQPFSQLIMSSNHKVGITHDRKFDSRKTWKFLAA